MATQIQLRRDTASNWTSNNPTLAAGEFGWESDTNRFKIGTGSAAWNSLGYASEGDTAGITFVGDDSTGTTVNQNETFKITGTQNITAVVSGDTLTLTGPDLSNYLTSVSQSDVTQHQAALSITESQISDLSHFSGSYTDLTNKPTIPSNNNQLTNGAGYITASSTDTLTNKSGNISQFTNDSGYKTSVSEADVTQHQAALSVTESQISDLGAYITDANITVVGDDSTGTSFSAKNNDNIKITGTQNTSVAVSGDTITVTGPDLSSYASTAYVDQEVAGIVDSAPGTLDTLNELAAALGDDANFATTTSTALGNRLRVDTNAQGLTTTQKTNAKTNLGLSTVASTGAYSDLSGTPTIPSNNNELTNGAGYITASSTDTLTNKSGNISQFTNDSNYKTSVSESDVTQHQSALSITESQISDLGSYITDANLTIVGDDSTGTSFSAKNNDNIKITGTQNLSVAVSGDTITVTGPDLSSYSTFSGSYTDLTNKPTIPTNNTELTNGAGYITASSTDTLTNKSGNISQWTNDAGYKTAVSQADVTQHQAALSITESQISDLSHFSGSYTDLTNKPTIPTNNTELTNGAGYITDANITIVGDDSTGTSFSAKNNDNIKITGTQNATVSVVGDTITVTGPDLSSYASTSYVDTAIANTIDSAPEALNTLNELAAALGDDANFATTTSTALGNRLRVDTAAQGLTATQKSNAKTNLGLSTVATSGAYSDLSGLPTIPTNNNQLTNGAGYITDYTVTQGDVTAHQAALSITESQISDLGAYITASSTDTLTNKSGNISQWTNDSGYLTTETSHADVVVDGDFASQGIMLRGATAGSYSILTDNSANWNTAYGWGDHSTAGYTTASSTTTFTNKSGNISQWTNDSGYSTFSGSYNDLTNKPTIPSALTDLSISDGTSGQVLTTDGAGNFTFTTVSGGSASTGDITFTGSTISSPSNADLTLTPGGTGKVVIDGFNFPTTDGSNGQVLTTDGAGNLSFTTVSGGAASTGDFTFNGNEMSTSSSNADMELGTSGTGAIVLKANGGSISNLNFTSGNRWQNSNILYCEDLSHTAGSRRLYGSGAQLRVKLDGTNTSSSNARFYALASNVDMDLNGTSSTNTSSSRGPHGINSGTDLTNSSATTANLGSMTGNSTYNYLYDYSGTGGDINLTNVYAFRNYSAFEVDGLTANATNVYGAYIGSPQAYSYNSSASTVTNSYGFYYNHNPDNTTFTNDPYAFYTNDDSVRSNPGALNKFNEYSYNATHSSGSTYTIDWANGNLQTVTLTSNISGFTMSNFPTSTKQSVGVTLYLVQDGTGSRSMTFSAASGETFKFANGVTTSSVSSANDIQTVYIFSRYNGSSNTYYWTIGPTYS